MNSPAPPKPTQKSFHEWQLDITRRAQQAQDAADWRDLQKGVTKLLEAPKPR